MEGERIWLFVTRLFPKDARAAVNGAGRAGWKSLGAYVRVQILVAAIDAIGIGIGAAILGVPLAIPLGVLVFLGSFVPVIGALISGAVAVLLALVALGPGTGADYARYCSAGSAARIPHSAAAHYG